MIIRLSGGSADPGGRQGAVRGLAGGARLRRRSAARAPDGRARPGAARARRRAGRRRPTGGISSRRRSSWCCSCPASRCWTPRCAIDPGLSDHAFSRNVVIATPTSLIALLRTIAFTWRQERLSASAAEMHALGRELHGRLGTVAGHLTSLGDGLETGGVSRTTTRSGRMETRVLVTARRFSDLGVTGEELPAAGAACDTVPRRPQATTRRSRDRRRPGCAAANRRETGLGRYR